MRTIFLIGIGSFIGGVARYLISRSVQGMPGSFFPWGTMLVNILGCLAIGLIFGLFERGSLLNYELRMFLTVGLCGGFTTFSTFMNENYLLLQDGNFLGLAVYTSLSLILGFGAVYLGYFIIKLF